MQEIARYILYKYVRVKIITNVVFKKKKNKNDIFNKNLRLTKTVAI